MIIRLSPPLYETGLERIIFMPWNKYMRILLVGLFGLAAFLLLTVRPGAQVYAATNDTIALTSPNNVTIAETDDYATQVLGNPWDMNQLDDLHWPHDFGPAQVGGGIWSATTTSSNGGSIQLQYQNFDNGYSYMGEKDGRNWLSPMKMQAGHGHNLRRSVGLARQYSPGEWCSH